MAGVNAQYKGIMGKFKKGEIAEGSVVINEDIAREYQRRSAAKRRKNKTIAESLRAYLSEEVGDGLTRGDVLVMQAVNNHKKGKLTFRDLRDLTNVLGEAVINVNTDGIRVVVDNEEQKRKLEKLADLDV